MTDKNTGKGRGFGFITLVDDSKIELILEDQPHVVDGKSVDCKRAIPKETISFSNGISQEEIKNLYNSKKIFVGGLHSELREFGMLNYFIQFGEIDECTIMTDKQSGKSRGFGFVLFKNETSVDKVMNMKTQHMIMDKWIDCKRAMPREVINRDKGCTNKKFSANLYYTNSPRNNLERTQEFKTPYMNFQERDIQNNQQNVPAGNNYIVNNYCKYSFYCKFLVNLVKLLLITLDFFQTK